MKIKIDKYEVFISYNFRLDGVVDSDNIFSITNETFFFLLRIIDVSIKLTLI